MSHHSPIHLRESWIICFFLGVIMLNFPFLHIFNKEAYVFGIPLLFLYFMVGWPLSIGVIYLFARSLKSENDDHEKPPPKG